MPVYVSPGVYTTILDLSLYIPNLSTTIAGFVGMASKGPLTTPTYVSNTLTFVTAFGQPNPNYMGPYAALQFLRYGSQAYYTRVAGASAAAASGNLLEQTTVASITSGVAGPFLVLGTNNNVLRTQINGDAGWLVITLTKGVRTTAQVASEIAGAIAGGGGDTNVNVTAAPDGTLKFTSTTLGATSAVKLDSVANGSTANPVFGFSSAGVTATGADADAGFVEGSGVTGPYTVVLGSNDSLEVTIDGTVFDITLPQGVQSNADIATAIQGIIGGAGTADPVNNAGNTVVQITSATTGTGSTVVVTGSPAATLLGLDVLLHIGHLATAATTDSSLAGPYTFGANNSLHLRFNGGSVRNIGLPSGLHSASAIATLINAIVGPLGYNEGVATVSYDGKVTISTLTQGTAASVQCDPGGSGQYALNLSTATVNGTGTPGVISLSVTGLYVGTYGNALTVVASKGTNVANTFKLTVYDASGGTPVAVEAWDNLTKTPSDSHFVETVINDVSTWIMVTDNPAADQFPAFATSFYLSGGNDGISDVTDADYNGVISAGQKTGMQVYANAETIDLNLLMVPGISSPAVINEMLLLCSVRGDCMCIVDPPLGLSVQQVADWHNGAGAYADHQAFNSLYGALYWPWLQIYDATNKQNVWVPPSGLVSGVYAFTDFTTETWFAPAGLNRGHLLQPLRTEYSPDQGERDLLYGDQNAVNPIVNFQKDGITVWGQRSLQRQPSALDRVNVVRLVLYLRKVIATAVKYLVFEPDDAITWATFVNLVEPYMESVKQRRGVVDYKVICDASTNPPDAIDRNEMHGIVALKPTKAAEFIEVKFAVVNQGANFQDLTF